MQSLIPGSLTIDTFIPATQHDHGSHLTWHHHMCAEAATYKSRVHGDGLASTVFDHERCTPRYGLLELICVY